MGRTGAGPGSTGKGKGKGKGKGVGGGGFVGKLPSSRRERLAVCLDALGYGVVPPPEHAVLAAKGEGVRVTLYESGKLLIQGARTGEVVGELQALDVLDGGVKTTAGASAKERTAARAGEPDPSAGSAHERERVVGSDEAGKGDFFGRLVVAACLVPPELRDALRALGVQDSKQLRDPRARSLAREIARRCTHEVLAISPARYNEMYPRFRGLNEMLAWAHGRAIEAVLERAASAGGAAGADRIVVDQFAQRESVVSSALGPLGKAVKLEQRTKGESEVAVAAASILARARFLDTLDALSERFELKLPKGASRQVEVAGRAFVAKHGADALGEVAKLHFRTSQRVLGRE